MYAGVITSAAVCKDDAVRPADDDADADVACSGVAEASMCGASGPISGGLDDGVVRGPCL